MKVKELLHGYIDGVIIKGETPYLIINRGMHDSREDFVDYLLPLLCPVCGRAWHFTDWQGSMKELEELLSDALKGYEIVAIRSLPAKTSDENVTQKVFYDPDLKPILVDNAAAHPGDQSFAAVHVILQKWVPSDDTAPEGKLPLRYEIFPSEGDAIEDVKMSLEGSLDDDLMIVVHLLSVLETVIVEPTITAEHNHWAALNEGEE